MTPPLEALRKLLDAARVAEWSTDDGYCPVCVARGDLPKGHDADCALSIAIKEAEAVLREAGDGR